MSPYRGTPCEKPRDRGVLGRRARWPAARKCASPVIARVVLLLLPLALGASVARADDRAGAPAERYAAVAVAHGGFLPAGNVRCVTCHVSRGRSSGRRGVPPGATSAGASVTGGASADGTPRCNACHASAAG